MLLTQELRKSLPALYACENDKDPIIWVKFFLPGTIWTWYAIEFDGEDLFFGYVAGEFPELGYFRLSELESVRGIFNLRVERDLYWTPTPLHKVMVQSEEVNRA